MLGQIPGQQVDPGLGFVGDQPQDVANPVETWRGVLTVELHVDLGRLIVERQDLAEPLDVLDDTRRECRSQQLTGPGSREGAGLAQDLSNRTDALLATISPTPEPTVEAVTT